MNTSELPPIEYKPTFRMDSSGLVVGTATQEEWDEAVAKSPLKKTATSKSIAIYPDVQCWKCKEIGHTRDMDYHVCSPVPVERPAACTAARSVK